MNPLIFLLSLLLLPIPSIAQEIPDNQAVTPSVYDRIIANLKTGQCSTPQRIKVYCEQMEDMARLHKCRV